jgi:hypothetical protein
MTTPTPAPTPSGGPAISTPTGTVVAGTPKRAGRISQELIDERREKVKGFLDKGLTSPTKIARALGVGDEMIRRDIKTINQIEKKKLTKQSAPDHVSTALGQLDEVVKNCFSDYLALTDKTSRAISVRSQLMTTAQRAIVMKMEVLMKTGVVPMDVTAVDHMIEAGLAEDKARLAFDPKLASVVNSDESRRKVLDLVEKLKEAPQEAQQALLAALNSEVDKSVTEPEDPEEPEEPEPEEPETPAAPTSPPAQKGKGGFGLPVDPELGI